MRPITIALSKIRQRKKLISWALIVLLAGVVFGGYFLITKGKLPKINLAGLLTAVLQKGKEKTEEEVKEAPPEMPEGMEIKVPQIPQSYEEEAKAGDGITHLARRALKRYLKDKGENLSPEQKIYVEDYLQNKTGDRWLKIGEKITFSTQLIEQAIQKAQNLTPEEIENLSQYAKLVPELNY